MSRIGPSLRGIRSALFLLTASLCLGAAKAASSSPPGVELPVIAGAMVPVVSSSAPLASDWQSAQAVRITRGDAGPCSASLVREWLRVRCTGWIGGGLVAGDPAGVVFSTTGRLLVDPDGIADDSSSMGVAVVLPLRRDAAAIVSFLALSQEYNSAAAAAGGVLSVVWRRGDANPVLSMTRAR